MLTAYARVSLTTTQSRPHEHLPTRRSRHNASGIAHGSRCSTAQALSACLFSAGPAQTNLLGHEQPTGLRQVEDRKKLYRIQERRRILANPVRGEIPVVDHPVGNHSTIFPVAEATADDGGGGSRANHQQQEQPRGEKARKRRCDEEELALTSCRTPVLATSGYITA